MDENLPTFITAVIVVVVLIIVVIIAAIHYQVDQAPVPTQFTTSSYGMRCSFRPQGPTSSIATGFVPQQCGAGLTCVETLGNLYGICRKSEGTPCTTLYECEPNMKICAGVCSLTAAGGLNQEPPCLAGLIAVSQPTGGPLCKLVPGSTCAESGDCAQGSCMAPPGGDTKICTDPLPYGTPCATNDQCFNGNCSMAAGIGICQPPTIATGQMGAACFYFDNGEGTPHDLSKITACQDDLVCSLVVNEGQFGVCTNAVPSWPSANNSDQCGPAAGCIPPTICVNSVNNGSVCVFPSPSISCGPGTSGFCLDNFTCNDAGVCVANANQPGAPGPNARWALVEWIRSANGKMGKWNFIQTVPPPGINASLSLLNTPSGWQGLYMNGGVLYTLDGTNAPINWSIPAGWTTQPILEIVTARYVPTTTNVTTLYVFTVGLNGRITTWVYISPTPTFTIPIPTQAAATAATALPQVMDADFDGRGVGRLSVSFVSNVSIYTTSQVGISFVPTNPTLTQQGTDARFFTLLNPPNPQPAASYFLFMVGNSIIASPPLSTAPLTSLRWDYAVRYDVSRQTVSLESAELAFDGQDGNFHYVYGTSNVVMPTNGATIGPVVFETTYLPTTRPRLFCIMTVTS